MYGSSFIIVTRRPRASRMAAREAAAMPLPREDTTPPVTKTSGVTEPGEVMGSTGRWTSAFYRFDAAPGACRPKNAASAASQPADHDARSEEHKSELQSLMRSSPAVFCCKKKKKDLDWAST